MTLEGLVFRTSEKDHEEYRLDLADVDSATYARYYLRREEVEKLIAVLQAALKGEEVRW